MIPDLFSLPKDQSLLLMKAEYFSRLQNVAEIEFTPIPKGISVSNGSTSIVSSDDLKNYINDKTNTFCMALNYYW